MTSPITFTCHSFDSPRRVSHHRNVNARCKTFVLFLFSFDYPRVNVASPTNNAVRPTEVVIESLAGRERSRTDRERTSYTMQSARTTARCSATYIGRRTRRGGAPQSHVTLCRECRDATERTFGGALQRTRSPFSVTYKESQRFGKFSDKTGAKHIFPSFHLPR